MTRRMLEKKTSHRKSQRVHTPRDDETPTEEVTSEVVAADDAQVAQSVVEVVGESGCGAA